MFSIFIILANIFAYPLFGAEEEKTYFDTIPSDVIIKYCPNDAFDFHLGEYHNRNSFKNAKEPTDEFRLEGKAFLLSLCPQLYNFTGALKFVAHVVSNKVESSKISPDQVAKLLEKPNLESKVFIKTVFGEYFTTDKFKHLHTQEFQQRFIPIFFDVCRKNGVMPIYILLRDPESTDNFPEQHTKICDEKSDTVKTYSHSVSKTKTLSCIQFNSIRKYMFVDTKHCIQSAQNINIYIDPKKIIIKTQPDEMHLVADIDLQDPQRLQIMGLFFRKQELRFTNKYLLPEDTAEKYNAGLASVNTPSQNKNSQDYFLKQKIEPIPQDWCYGWNTTRIMLANLCKTFNAQCVATYYAMPWCMQKLTEFYPSPLIITTLNTANYLFFHYQPKHPENHTPLSRFIDFFKHPRANAPLKDRLLIPLARLLFVSSPCIISKFFPSVLPSICAMSLCISFFHTICQHSPLFKYQNITCKNPIKTSTINVIISKKV